MSKFFKGLKKAKKEATPVPRPLAEIQKDNNELMSELAKNEYQIFVLKRANEYINNRLLSINQEGGARLALDKEVAKTETSTAGA